jgi:methionine sulfoxide reductase heme-binding subunit
MSLGASAVGHHGIQRPQALTLGTLACVAAGAAALAATGGSWQIAARWTAWASCTLFVGFFLYPAVEAIAPSAARRFGRAASLHAFVAAHVVHLFTLLTYVALSGHQHPPSAWIMGGLAYACVLAAVLVDERQWPRAYSAGLWFVWLIFLLTFAERLGMAGREATGTIGVAVMLTAALGRWWGSRTRKAAAVGTG